MNSIAGLPDEKLLARAVRAARSTDYAPGVSHPRWAAVMKVFALGSTRSRELLQRFGLDPDEPVLWRRGWE